MNYIELTIFRILKAQSEIESDVCDEYLKRKSEEIKLFFILFR